MPTSSPTPPGLGSPARPPLLPPPPNRPQPAGALPPEQPAEALGIPAHPLEIAAANFPAYDPTVDPGAAETLTRLVRDVAVAATPEAP